MQEVTSGLAILLPLCAAASLAVLATWWDVRWRRIPNALTVSGFTGSLIVCAILGTHSVVSGLTAAAISLALGFALFGLGVMGAGDAKLLVAFAPLLGVERLPLALMLSGVAGGLLAFVMALRAGVLLPVAMNAGDLLFAGLGLRKGADRQLARTSGLTVPYGVAIAVGVLGAWFV